MSFGLPSLITALCAAFVLLLPHFGRTVSMEYAGMLARFIILGSFLFVAHQARRVKALHRRSAA